MRIMKLAPLLVRKLAPLLLAVAVSGCASAAFERIPVPADSFRDAKVRGFDQVRVWADEAPKDVDIGSEIQSLLDGVTARAEADGRPPSMNLLAISGGAADGAYGAGVLNGWTERGDRPVFDVVTGISTGALIAPFAFLGSEKDAELKRLFTETSTEQVAELALFSFLFRGALSLADSEPLRRRIEEGVSDEMIDRIAEESDTGRVLLIGTTNLDARRPVIWNASRIAQIRTPAARKLFRDVLAASAAIPGAFKPAFFDVEVNGVLYREMHVDGGVANSVFIAPSWFTSDRFSAGNFPGGVTLWVLQNNKVVPDYGPTEDSLVGIAGDSISEMIRNQSRGDLLRLFAIAKRRGFEFQLANVPTDFDEEAREDFDPVYMRALFDVGLQHGLAGDAWSDIPPGLPALLFGDGVVAEAPDR